MTGRYTEDIYDEASVRDLISGTYCSSAGSVGPATTTRKDQRPWYYSSTAVLQPGSKTDCCYAIVVCFFAMPTLSRCHVGGDVPREKEQKAYTFSQTLRSQIRGLNIVAVREMCLSLSSLPK